MAEQYFPFDAGAGASSSEDRWRRIFESDGDGVITGLAVTETTPQDQAVLVGVGRARLRGGFHYFNDTAKTITLTSATNRLGGAGTEPSAAQSRVDAIVVRIDPTGNTITAGYIAGTPSTTGTQQPPAATQTDGGTWDLLLAYVTRVGTGAVTNSNIVDFRTIVAPVVTLASTASFPTMPDGSVIFQSGRVWVRESGSWRPTIARGRVDTTTSGGGVVTVAHDLGVSPTAVAVQMTGPASSEFAARPVVINQTTSQITVRFYNDDPTLTSLQQATSYLAGVQVQFHWIATR